MCNTPITWVPAGKLNPIQIPCRSCRSCIADTINDHTARGVCEAAAREWSCVLTLTYRDQDDGSHKVLTKEHFQLAMKRLRRKLGTIAKKAGTKSKVTYVVAGEYGDLKGRAHFHVCLFGDGPRPEFPQRKRFWPEWFWHFGHVFADWNVDAPKVRYVMKYLYKWSNCERWISRSNGQPLGWDYQSKRIEAFIKDGVFFRDWLYTVPGMKKKARMSDATRRRFVFQFLWRWCVDEKRRIPWEQLSETVAQGMRQILHTAKKWYGENDPDMSLEKLLKVIDDEYQKDRITERAAVRAAFDAMLVCPKYVTEGKAAIAISVPPYLGTLEIGDIENVSARKEAETRASESEETDFAKVERRAKIAGFEHKRVGKLLDAVAESGPFWFARKFARQKSDDNKRRTKIRANVASESEAERGTLGSAA